LRDTEYQRIVGELKQSKAHNGIDTDDVPTWTLAQQNILSSILLVSTRARVPLAAMPDVLVSCPVTRARAQALMGRVESLPLQNFHPMMQAVGRVHDRVKDGTLTDIDAALATIEAEVYAAERAR
jgi:hypothetical protein